MPSTRDQFLPSAETLPLLERASELAVLDHAISEAGRGTGSTAYVEGPAGVGKTRLLFTAAHHGATAGLGVVRATGRELERDFAFGVVVQLFEPYWLRADGRRIDRLFGGAARAAMQLADGGHPHPDEEFALIRALTWLARQLGQESSGLMVIVDDAHRSDEASLRFLAYLAARVTDLPIALLAAGDQGDRRRAPALTALRDSADVLLRPAPLGLEGTAALVRTHVPGADSGLSDTYFRDTGGNPFLLTELLSDLPLVAGKVGPAHHDVIGEHVPHAVLSRVAAQLADLNTASALVAGTVAELGDGTDLARVAAVAELDINEAAEGAEALARARVLRAGESLRFESPMLRRAVHTLISPSELKRLRQAPPAVDGTLTAAPEPFPSDTPARRGRQLAGLRTLTFSERRVAGLAAQGRTTRQIAAELFVTSKTVEFHLRHIYKKLEIPSNRDELVRTLRSEGLIVPPSG
ncbi:MAG: AAA family ATPase [Solirubrobacteraceae bacterium]